MKNKKIILTLILFASCFYPSGAQEIITLEQSIKMALENNFSIKIAKEESNISKNNNTLGNAGMLPEVMANGSFQNSSNNTQQNFVDGREINRDGAQSTNLVGGVALNWTLFDGMQMFLERSKLKDLQEIGEIQFRIKIENTLSELMNQYYEAIRINYLIDFQQKQIQLLNKREEIVRNRFQGGLGPKTDVLQTEIDQNNAQVALLALQQQYTDAKFTLQLLMGRKGNNDFEIEKALPDPGIFEENTLAKSLREKNNEVKSAELQIGFSEKEIKKLRGQQMPKIGLNLGYNYSRSTAEAGFILKNQNLGFNYGLSASLPIFTGFTTRTKIQNAMIMHKTDQLRLEETILNKETELKQALNNLARLKEMLPVIQKNQTIAENVFSIAQEQFKNGSNTILELREAEQEQFKVINDLASLKINIKKAEVRVLKLTGGLLKG